MTVLDRDARHANAQPARPAPKRRPSGLHRDRSTAGREMRQVPRAPRDKPGRGSMLALRHLPLYYSVPVLAFRFRHY